VRCTHTSSALALGCRVHLHAAAEQRRRREKGSRCLQDKKREEKGSPEGARSSRAAMAA
jgi:hypothetical protein